LATTLTKPQVEVNKTKAQLEEKDNRKSEIMKLKEKHEQGYLQG
jgi:hypothetical protein